MAIPREKKEKILGELEENLKSSKMVILTNFQGLKVEDLYSLRKRAKTQEIKYKVAKNTLLKLALNKAGISLEESIFGSPLALGFGQDEITLCRIIYNFSKDNPQLKIKGGILEKKFVPFSYIESLASLPTQEELYLRLISGLKAPLYRLNNVLIGNIRSLIYLLNYHKEKSTSTLRVPVLSRPPLVDEIIS